MTLRNPELNVNHNGFVPSLPFPLFLPTVPVLATVYELVFNFYVKQEV